MSTHPLGPPVGNSTHPLGPPVGNQFQEFCEQLESDGMEFPDYLKGIPKFGLCDQQILFLENEFLSIEVELLTGTGWGNQASQKRFGLIRAFTIGAAPAMVGRWFAKRRFLEEDLTNPNPQSETTALTQSNKRKTPEQIEALNAAYEDDYFPDPDVIDDLMIETGLKRKVIQSYFVHKRKKQRCDGDPSVDYRPLFAWDDMGDCEDMSDISNEVM